MKGVYNKKVVDEIQVNILSGVYQNARKNEFILKGGFGIRVVAGSPRYTMDIDFDARYTMDIDLDGNPGIHGTKHQNVIRRAVKKALLESPIIEDTVVTEPKQTDTVLRWKINGKDVGTEDLLNIKVEVSMRDKINEFKVESVYYNPPVDYHVSPFLVDAYKKETLLSMKIGALLSENRSHPRDIYDIHLFTVRGVMPDMELLEEITEKAHGKEKATETIWFKADNMDYKLCRTELLPVLPDNIAGRFDERMWDEVRLKASKATEGWISGLSGHKNKTAMRKI